MRLKLRLLPDKMFGRHGTHPTLVQKGAHPLLEVSCVCCVDGFGVCVRPNAGKYLSKVVWLEILPCYISFFGVY